MQRGFILIGMGENHCCNDKNVFFFSFEKFLQSHSESQLQDAEEGKIDLQKYRIFWYRFLFPDFDN